MTVAQNVEYGLRVRGVGRDRTSAPHRRRPSRWSGSPVTRHASPPQLSGGQQQRVALARALVGRPRVLLLDEPLGALDLKLREQMQVELKAIQREVGITFVIVTHDQDEALTLCDRLAVFNNGRIEQIGAAREVYENPANRFVADFVGTSNVLDGAAAEALLGRRGHLRDPARAHRVLVGAADRARRACTASTADGVPRWSTPARSPGSPPRHRLAGVRAHRDRCCQRRGVHRPSHHGTPVVLAWPDTAVHRSHIGSTEGVAMTSTPSAVSASRWPRARALVLAGCSSSDDSGGTARRRHRRWRPPTAVGDGEGELNLIAWAGYAENGSNDPTVDWVTPFEKETGCKVNVKLGNTSDEMVQLMRTGQYDGVSASGDATLRLIYAGDVAPVNTDLVPNYATIVAVPQGQAVELGRRPDVRRPARLGRQPADVQHRRRSRDAPDSWGAVFPGAPEYKGKVTAYDSPIYIADAALYLSKTKPELGIKDPYSLTAEQLDAAVDLLKQQKENIGEYWSDYTKEVQAFESGTSVIGTTWQVIANTIERRQQGQDRHGAAQGRLHRLVGHLDALVEGRASQLHVQVDGLDHLAGGQRPGGRILR